MPHLDQKTTGIMKADTFNSYQERILRVLTHISANLDGDLSLPKLARLAHFSPYHFHRIFRGMVRESVQEHIRRLRLERAAMRLKTGHQPVIQIALEAGYEAHESFSRSFKQMFGMPPTKFRASRSSHKLQHMNNRVHFSPSGLAPDFCLKPQGDSQMDVQIEKTPAIRVAFIRHTGPYIECGKTWEKLCAWAGPKGLLGPTTRFIGLCYDDPEVTPSDKIRYDASITVGAEVQATGEVGIQDIPAGEYAKTIHRGPYEKLAETYGELCGQWLPQSGRELHTGPGFEVYLNHPDQTAPADLVTEIHMPLKPA